MRSEEEIRDKIEDLSYIFDISDDLMVRYQHTTKTNNLSIMTNMKIIFSMESFSGWSGLWGFERSWR